MGEGGFRSGKHSYTKTAGSDGVGCAPKAPVHILWVHSTTVEKGKVSEGYFNQVNFKCHQIKVKGVLNGEDEHMWCPTMHGQPSYDKYKSRGKIICLDQKTVDYWVKWVQITSLLIGKIPCKAWTREEYMIKVVRYSCLIPKNTCDSVDVEDLVNATLQMHSMTGMDSVVSCHTTYTQHTNQHICNLEVTEALAVMFESCNRVLSGPVGHLTFKRRSDDKDETTDNPSTMKIQNCQRLNQNAPQSMSCWSVGRATKSTMSNSMTPTC